MEKTFWKWSYRRNERIRIGLGIWRKNKNGINVIGNVKVSDEKSEWLTENVYG